MEMCCDGALVLPSSYAVLDEKEMTYVEGGVALPNWLVGNAINLAIDVLVVGGTRKAASFFTARIRKYGVQATKTYFSKELKKKLIAKGIANGVAAGACGIAAVCITVLTWAVDPGGSLAMAMDNRDHKPGNGFVNI